MRDAVAAGLGDEVLDGQRCFRALLEAMSRPRRVARLGEALPVPPAPLEPASYAFLLALADFETPVWLDPEAGRPEVEATLRFRCGCPLTTDPAAAAFAVVTDPVALPPLETFAQGTPEYPDRSTTIVLQVADLGTGEMLRLRGPGVLGGRGCAWRVRGRTFGRSCGRTERPSRKGSTSCLSYLKDSLDVLRRARAADALKADHLLHLRLELADPTLSRCWSRFGRSRVSSWSRSWTTRPASGSGATSTSTACFTWRKYATRLLSRR